MVNISQLLYGIICELIFLLIIHVMRLNQTELEIET